MEQPASIGLSPEQVQQFRRKLCGWYRKHARKLPWRGSRDSYAVWVSEVMLQQTRVAAVLDHYERFLLQFPSLVSLALAAEADVLAVWSGLGYYRRARMLHKAAQFVMQQLGGNIPQTAAELRTLPGVGEYTCAAVASIAFGESIAVVDGNVERVLLRVTGRREDATAAGRAFVRAQAAALVPPRRFSVRANAAGDHNQAMMELGATICLPRAPLCLNCAVYDLCRTRGEHVTAPRKRQNSRPIAFLLETRKRGATTEVLLERRSEEASLMPGMLELPPLSQDVVEGRKALLQLRHSITNTNYHVAIYMEGSGSLRETIPAAKETLSWHPLAHLSTLPLTGLARKVLRRIDLRGIAGPETPEAMVDRGRVTGSLQ